jgi:hypothetical protein
MFHDSPVSTFSAYHFFLNCTKLSIFVVISSIVCGVTRWKFSLFFQVKLKVTCEDSVVSAPPILLSFDEYRAKVNVTV